MAVRPFALLALALLLAGGSTFAAENTTDLRGFIGGYRGTGEVALGQDPTYKGRATITIKSLSPTSLRLTVNATVRTPRGLAAISNVFTFATSGKMRAKELAPGITERAPMAGEFGAGPSRIAFEAPFEFGDSKGRASGTVRKNPSNGRLLFTYSIFLEGSTPAVYTYTYEVRGKKTTPPAP